MLIASGVTAIALLVALAVPPAATADHEGIVLYTPAQGSSVYSNQPVRFTWFSPYGHANGSFQSFATATSPDFQSGLSSVEFYCPPSSACPQEVTRGPFPPGTYYWRVEWGDGSNHRTSDVWSFTSVPPPTPPSNTGTPSISGTPWRGLALTASPGTWASSVPVTYTYEWRRCDTAGGSCATVARGASNSYTLTDSDVGLKIRVLVTAENPGGSASALSDAYGTVLSGAPPPPPPAPLPPSPPPPPPAPKPPLPKPRYQATVRSIHPGAIVVPGSKRIWTYPGDTLRITFRNATAPRGLTSRYRVCYRGIGQARCRVRTLRGSIRDAWRLRIRGAWVPCGRQRPIRFSWSVKGQTVATRRAWVWECS
jgi:hypothetical protein